MKVSVWRYADEEDPSESYTALDAGLIGENTVKIHVDEANIVTINGFYKFTTELDPGEVEYLQEQRQKMEELERKAEMRQFGNQLSI